jgi:hypothetical protein
MKIMRFAALLVALATPAWAANDDKPLISDGLKHWLAAVELCENLGGNSHICGMRHASTELSAIDMAQSTLRFCDQIGTIDPSYAPECADARAYIKQRWGY